MQKDSTRGRLPVGYCIPVGLLLSNDNIMFRLEYCSFMILIGTRYGALVILLSFVVYDDVKKARQKKRYNHHSMVLKCIAMFTAVCTLFLNIIVVLIFRLFFFSNFSSVLTNLINYVSVVAVC